MSTYDRIRSLPLHVDGYYLEPLEQEVARDFTLRRTTVVLHGRGEEGRGEEVDYDPAAQQRFQAEGGKLPLAGEHSLESFSLLHSGQTANTIETVSPASSSSRGSVSSIARSSAR